MSDLDFRSRQTVIDALASGLSVSAAAREANYSRVHVQRLRKDKAFSALVAKRKAELEASPAPTVSPLESRSLAVLEEIRDDTGQEGTVRVSACKALLAFAAAKASRKPVAASQQPKGADVPKAPAPSPEARATALRVLERVRAERQGGSGSA